MSAAITAPTRTLLVAAQAAEWAQLTKIVLPAWAQVLATAAISAPCPSCGDEYPGAGGNDDDSARGGNGAPQEKEGEEEEEEVVVVKNAVEEDEDAEKEAAEAIETVLLVVDF